MDDAVAKLASSIGGLRSRAGGNWGGGNGNGGWEEGRGVERGWWEGVTTLRQVGGPLGEVDEVESSAAPSSGEDIGMYLSSTTVVLHGAIRSSKLCRGSVPLLFPNVDDDLAVRLAPREVVQRL